MPTHDTPSHPLRPDPALYPDDPAERRLPHRLLDSLAASFLLALLAAGSLALWTAAPAFGLWAAGHLARANTAHYVIGLPLAFVAMGVWGLLLLWVNGLYLRVTGHWRSPDDPHEPPRRLRGPVEPLLVGSLYLAIVAFVVWLIAFATNPGPGIGI